MTNLFSSLALTQPRQPLIKAFSVRRQKTTRVQDIVCNVSKGEESTVNTGFIPQGQSLADLIWVDLLLKMKTDGETEQTLQT